MYSVLRRSAFVLLVSVLMACGPARAGEPGSPTAHPARSASDTSHSLARRFRFYMSGGSSWITAPEASRQHTEAGVGFEGGLEANPSRGLRLHLGVEYAWLPVHRSVAGVLLAGIDPEGNPIGTHFSGDQTGTGGAFALHVEPQLIVLPGTWLLVGGGVAHLSTQDPNAFKAGIVYPASNGGPPVLVTRTDGPNVSGWAGSWTLGLRRDLKFLGPRFGLELRWSALETGATPLHMASVRFGL